MRWGIYSIPGFEGAAAWAEGLAELGHAGVLRSAWDYSRDCFESDLDAVVVFGLHGRGRQILDHYQSAGVPVVVIDYGYLKRTNHAHDWRTGYWQVSVGGLNRLPDGVDGSRFEALGLEVAQRGGDPRGYVLLCVQTPGDASHGRSADELQAWCREMASRWPGLLIRPHPLLAEADYGLPRCQAGTLSEALAGARLVVTGNSNTGHDALLAGVPAVATFDAAAWADLSGEELPSRQARIKHFHRCAWGQWTWQEFRAGLPQQFLVGRKFR